MDIIGDQHFVSYSEVSLNGGTVGTFGIVCYIVGVCSTVIVMLLCVNIIMATAIYFTKSSTTRNQAQPIMQVCAWLHKVCKKGILIECTLISSLELMLVTDVHNDCENYK